MVHIIDGKKIAKELRNDVAERVKLLSDLRMITPGLATIMVGDDPASSVYVNMKKKFAEEVGMNSYQYDLPSETTTKELVEFIDDISKGYAVHGILVQLPLPKHIDVIAVLNAIPPEMDVDGFHPLNAGKLVTGQTDGFVPCTPMGCMKLIKSYQKDITGMNAVVVGRSNIVGKPLVQTLLQENCTVSSANVHTKNLSDLCKMADILIVAAGNPQFIRGEWIKPGAIVIDVGINRVDGKIVGDVNFAEAVEVAGAITPVPGGVGPMTIACLLSNTLKAAWNS